MTSAQLQRPVHALSGTGRLVRSSDAVWRVIPGAAVVVLPQGARGPVVLAGTGLTLWEELRAPLSLDELATRMAAQYDVRPDDVRDVLADVLLDLRHKGVVRDHDD